jgi:hypothetical protein
MVGFGKGIGGLSDRRSLDYSVVETSMDLLRWNYRTKAVDYNAALLEEGQIVLKIGCVGIVYESNF